MTRDQVRDLAKKTDLDFLTRRMDALVEAESAEEHSADAGRRQRRHYDGWETGRMTSRMERAVHHAGDRPPHPVAAEERIMTDPRKVQTFDDPMDDTAQLIALAMSAAASSPGRRRRS